MEIFNGTLLVYYKPNKELRFIPAFQVKNMTAGEFLEYFRKTFFISDNLMVSIKSNTGNKVCLEKFQHPFSFCPYLFFFRIQEDFEGLAISEIKSKITYYLVVDIYRFTSCCFKIPIISNSGNLLYSLRFRAPQTIKLNSLLDHLHKLHSLPPTSFKVMTLYDEEYQSDKSLLRDLFYQRLYVCFDSTAQMKSINDRVNPIKEFKLTEKTYLNDIKGFDFNVGKVLKSGLLSESESSSLLSAMRPVVKITEEIYSDLEKMRLDYMTMIGKHFSAFIPYLKIYKNYISVYDSLQLKLAKSQNNPKNKNVLDEFSKTIYAGGRSLDSVLSIPFQRTMRYRMLLEAVLKKTPKVHPDHKFLIEAIEKLKTILLDVDRATNNVKKSQEMLQLNIRFEPLNIIKPQRSLIGCYQANGTNCEYTLIIFSDEFWVAKKLPENKLERKRVIQWSEANIQITSDLSVVISMFESYSQTFTFQDIKTRDGFIQQFRETAIYSNSAKSDIKITVQMTLSKFAMSNHSMVISDDFLWLFGGFDERGRLVNNLTILKISNHKCKILQQTENGEVWPCPRRDSAMGFAKNKVYVYGGNDGTQDLSDFWCYDVRKKKWINLDNEEGNIPGSGSGLQLTFVNDYFLLSGGKTEFEVYKYVISANEWTKMPLQTKYKALRHHSFIPKNDDSFLILGGVDLENHNNNDIMLYSNEILEPIDTTFLSPLCIYNTSLINDDYLFVFGGKEEPTPFLLSLRDFSWETPMVEKGQLSTLWDFTMSSYGSRVIILFGNNENGCSKAMYKLSFKLPDKCEGEKLLELINMNGRKRSKSISKK